jgi:uncharacterized membrane protein
MALTPDEATAQNIFLRMNSIHRFIIGSAAALITFLFIRSVHIGSLLKGMILWDAFAIVILVNSWIVFFTCSPSLMRKKARKEDGSRAFVFGIVLISSMASMVTVLLLVLSKNTGAQSGLYIPVAVGGMLVSWVMVHTTYTFHYAYLYYGDDDEQPEIHAEGLEFPEEKEPDYLDFAYFAFVIGMTFQVSDVQITSRNIRRKVLVHGLLAFVLNTFVVALTVNLIAGLKS